MLYYMVTEFLEKRYNDYYSRSITYFKFENSRAIPVYNKESARKYLNALSYTKDQVSWIIEFENEIITNPKLNRLLAKGSVGRVLDQYTFSRELKNFRSSIFQSIHEDLNQAINRLEKLDFKSPIVIKNLPMVNDLMKKFKNFAILKEFPEEVLEFISSELTSADFFLNMLEGGSLQQLFKKFPPSFKNMLVRKFKDIDPINFHPLPGEWQEKQKISTLTECKEKFEMTLARSLQDENIEWFKSEIHFLESKAQQFLSHIGLGSIKHIVKEKIAKTQYNIPGSKVFNRHFYYKQLSNYSIAKEEHYIATPFLTIMNYKDDRIKNEALLKLCGSHLANYDVSLDDSVVSGDERPLMNVSWKTIVFAENYKLILAHEFGHLIYNVINDLIADKNTLTRFSSSNDVENISNFFQCHTDVHIGKPYTQITQLLDEKIEVKMNQYSNEDLADLFSGYVYQASTVYNSMCKLDSDYMKSELNLVNSDETDMHSASFYRVINVENILRGSIPKACQEILETQEKIQINQCLQ